MDDKKPRRVLIIKKKYNNDASKVLRGMIDWFNNQGIQVMVEPDVFEELQPCNISTWKEEVKNVELSLFPGSIQSQQSGGLGRDAGRRRYPSLRVFVVSQDGASRDFLPYGHAWLLNALLCGRFHHSAYPRSRFPRD